MNKQLGKITEKLIFIIYIDICSEKGDFLYYHFSRNNVKIIKKEVFFLNSK